MKVKSKLPSILSKVKHKTKVVVASVLVASLIPFWVFGLIFCLLCYHQQTKTIVSL